MMIYFKKVTFKAVSLTALGNLSYNIVLQYMWLSGAKNTKLKNDMNQCEDVLKTQKFTFWSLEDGE